MASVTANAATFSAPAISTTLNAFATLDLPAPTEAGAGQQGGPCVTGAHCFTPSWLDLHPTSAPCRAVSALVAQMQATLQGFGSPALASTIWSLAKLGHAMTAKERQSLIQRLEEVAMDLGPQVRAAVHCCCALCSV